MFQPDPVVFLGIERVFDQMPFPPAAIDDGRQAFGRKIGEIGDMGVEGGRLGSDFPLQDDVGLMLAEDDVLDPAKVLLALLTIASEQAMPVGGMERQQVEEFLPGGGLAAFFDGQDVFPDFTPSKNDKNEPK
jgi:hypothetical protein